MSTLTAEQQIRADAIEAEFNNRETPAAQTAELFTEVDKLMVMEYAVWDLEEKLTEAKRKLQKQERQIIPDLMQNANVSEVKLADGGKVTVNNKLRVQLPKKGSEERDEAFKYLDELGAGPLIKDKLEVTFEKGQHNLAMDKKADLEEAGFTVIVDKDVHWSTLDKFAKERAEAGTPFDEDRLATFSYREVKITGVKR